jgi:hypothetical protein
MKGSNMSFWYVFSVIISFCVSNYIIYYCRVHYEKPSDSNIRKLEPLKEHAILSAICCIPVMNIVIVILVIGLGIFDSCTKGKLKDPIQKLNNILAGVNKEEEEEE